MKKKDGCAILTEAQEYGVNGHIVHIKEQNGNCIRKYHHYLRRKKRSSLDLLNKKELISLYKT